MMTDKPNKSASKLFVTAKKKTIAKAIVFFSYIRLTASCIAAQ